MNQETKLSIFKKMCYSRCFEDELARIYKTGIIKSEVYLSTGQESIPATLSEIYKDSYIFPQHRADHIYLSFGGDPNKLIDEILTLPTGCLHGKGGHYRQSDRIFGHSGLIGDQCALAVGWTLGTGKPSIVFMGDGAVEEDSVFPTMGFAVKHELPILFVCEDNNLSILTKVEDRRSWYADEVAEAYGLDTTNCIDYPETIEAHIKVIKVPAFINIETNRYHWHSGVGVDEGSLRWDTYSKFRGEIPDADTIESETERDIKELWARHLKIL